MGGGHSVEDHYLHINVITFWGEVANLGGGGDSPKTDLQEALMLILFYINLP